MTVLSYPFAWLPVAIVLGVSATLAAPLLAFVGLIVFVVVALVAVVASARRLVAPLRAVAGRLRSLSGTAGAEELEACLGKEVTTSDAYVGDFFLATPVAGHPAGTIVHVTVSALCPSRLGLDFSDDHQVLTDACVLLCGQIGALELLEVGYTGPLARRPRLASAPA